MRKQFTFQIFFIAVLTCCLTSSAEEWVSNDKSVSFQIPDDSAWVNVKPPQPEVKLLLQRTDKTANMFVLVVQAPTDGKVLDQFIRGFEKGYWQKGISAKRTGEFSDFKGKRVYKTSGDMTIQNIIIKKAAIVWIQNDKVFEISTMKQETDPLDDVVIKKFLESASFSTNAVHKN